MDWNNDGKTDLIAGDSKGQVWLFLNEGTKEEPKLAEGVRVEAGGKPIVGKQNIYKKVGGQYELDHVVPGNHDLADKYSKIHMADWNGDGLKDLLIGQSGEILFYRNSGTPSEPRFEDPEELEDPGVAFPRRPSPYVVDWDGDGKRDLLVGTDSSKVYFYRNVGTDAAPELADGEVLRLEGDRYAEGYRCRIDVTDWNNDGKLDLLVGNRYRYSKEESGGNIWLFLGQ